MRTKKGRNFTLYDPTHMKSIGRRVRYIGTNFGPKFVALGGVIYGNKGTLHCVWRDFAVRFDNSAEFAVYAKDIVFEAE